MSPLSAAVAETVVFEPVVNLPALGSFLFIAVIFTFLITRVGAVERAAERRKAALKELRAVKSKELDATADEASVARALQEYEDAINAEEELRTLIPGVRVVAPNQPAGSSEEDIAAARQFLGIELEKSASLRKEDGERKGLSTGAVAVLAIVALSQLALLYMLSFDPMDTFASLSGPPPSELPPTSW